MNMFGGARRIAGALVKQSCAFADLECVPEPRCPFRGVRVQRGQLFNGVEAIHQCLPVDVELLRGPDKGAIRSKEDFERFHEVSPAFPVVFHDRTEDLADQCPRFSDATGIVCLLVVCAPIP